MKDSLSENLGDCQGDKALLLGASGCPSLSEVMRLSKIVDERLKKCQSGSCHSEVKPLRRAVSFKFTTSNSLIFKE